MDWSKAKPEVVKEVVREAEAYLAGQVQLATSADQRASVMASVFAAAGAAVVAALITVASSNDATDGISIYLGGSVAALLFLGGACFCVWAAMPTGFDLPGNEPESWKTEIESGRELNPGLCDQAENYQEKITENRAALKRNAHRFKIGALSGIGAPLFGSLVWLVVSAMCF